MVSPARIASGSSFAQRIRKDDAVRRTQPIDFQPCAHHRRRFMFFCSARFSLTGILFSAAVCFVYMKPGQGSVFIVCHRRVKKCQISEKKSLIATSQLLSGCEIVTSSSV